MVTKKKTLKKGSAKTKVQATAQPQTSAQPTQPQQPAGQDLSIADLKNLATIIDVASTRGSFRANEMATVGAMYNKLQAFLAKVAPEQKPEDKKTDAPATATK
tara:strand:- start:246 stop:554 length:309 start_codon:yes stop_codon:yes gene_type:complete